MEPEPAATHTAFFGDKEHNFRLGVAEIRELERTTGTGIGSLFKRVIAGLFGINDLLETIRLGLIGGGMDPQTAADMIGFYGNRPIAETLPIAISVLEIAWFGTPSTTSEDQQ